MEGDISRPSPAPRPQSRASVCSTTTYHSFQDAESFEPNSPGGSTTVTTVTTPNSCVFQEDKAPAIPHRSSRRKLREHEAHDYPGPRPMMRQDSGYESGTTPPSSRKSRSPPKRRKSPDRPFSPSRPPQTSQSRSRRQWVSGRPSNTNGGPVSYVPARSSLNLARSSLNLTRPSFQQPRSSMQLPRSSLQLSRPPSAQSNAFFHFPAPESVNGTRRSLDSTRRPSIDVAPPSRGRMPVLQRTTTVPDSDAICIHNQSTSHANCNPTRTSHECVDSPHLFDRLDSQAPTRPPIGVPSPPPQTTHYWTSDRRRRLEYAAIDAASRGVKGWMMRNMVPDCFMPEESRRHVGFDDDAGSIRRYRLDLADPELEADVRPDNDAEPAGCFAGALSRKSMSARERPMVALPPRKSMSAPERPMAFSRKSASTLDNEKSAFFARQVTPVGPNSTLDCVGEKKKEVGLGPPLVPKLRKKKGFWHALKVALA